MKSDSQPHGCPTRFRRRLDRLLAGDLSPRAEKRLRRHLQRCAECRQRLRELQALRAWLRSTPRPVLERDLTLSPADVPTRRAVLWYPRLRSATAVVAVLVAILFLVDLLPATVLPPERSGIHPAAVEPTSQVTVPPPSVMVAPAITRRPPPVTATEGDVAAVAPTAIPEPSPSPQQDSSAPSTPSPWIRATVSRPGMPVPTSETDGSTIPWWSVRMGGLFLMGMLTGLTWWAFQRERRFL